MTVRSSLLAFAALAVATSIAFAEPAAKRPPAERPDREVEKPAAVERPLPASIDLSGEWRMFLPAGWERNVRIERLGENRYYVHPPYVMKGTYEIRGRAMTFVSEVRLDGDAAPESEKEAKTARPAREPFVWTVRTPYLMTLTGGADDYRDAVLFRSNGREIQDRKIPKDDAPSPAEGASPARPADAFPLAEDMPPTKLEVKLTPGERGTMFDDGDLVFPVTIRNDSKQPIQLRVPVNREAESSLAALVRLVEPAHVEKRERPPLAKQVFRESDEAIEPDVTILPGESLEFDARLNLLGEDEPQRRLEPRRKYEIRLTLTFSVRGKLQHVAGQRGSVVTFDPAPRAR